MFRFKLVSLSGVQYEDDVHEVLLPTMEGEIGVLTGHMPLVSVATYGVIAVRKEPKDTDNDREYFACSGGVIEVANGELSVMVDEADHADTINEAEAEAAYERAQAMKAEAGDEVSLERAQQMVDRHAVRLQVTSLKRRHRKH